MAARRELERALEPLSRAQRLAFARGYAGDADAEVAARREARGRGEAVLAVKIDPGAEGS